MGIEVELKLSTSKRGLQQAAALPWLKELTRDAGNNQQLTSVYFDTDDIALRKHGISLRVRHAGGRRLQTIKANSSALITRQEWETEIDRDEPELELARGTELAPLLKPKLIRRLRPVFETRIDRIVRLLKVGNSEVELALDDGCIVSGEGKLNIAEIEIELKAGEPSDVAQLARRIAGSVPVGLSVRSKSELGYALLDGALQAPMFSEPVAVDPKGSVAEAFEAIGLACLRQVAGNEDAVRRSDPDGIHQMRVGLRRLRAALTLFKEIFHEDALKGIKQELKWLTEELAPARDYDVFVRQTLARYRAEHPDWRELEPLEHELDDMRRAGFASARRAVESERFRRLVLDCALWVFDGQWRRERDPLARALRERPASAFARNELERRLRKVAKRAKKLDRLEWRKRHKLRIAVKKVRYGRDFFASVRDDSKKAGRKLDRSLKRLQNGLGHLNDMHVHLELSRDLARPGKSAEKAFAIGRLTGLEQASASAVLADALAAGRQLRKAL